jgi:O-antigen/teichoic acid export membrane protein
VAVGGAVLAQPIILTLYGPSYEPAGVALAILIWDVPLLLLAAFFGNVTAALGLERPAFKVYLACTGLNVAINVLLIPQYGMIAASAATLISDGSALALFFILLHKRIELGQVWPILGRVALAAGLMGVVVWLTRPLGWPVAMASGMVSYGLLVTVMRLVDWSSLIAPIRRRITLFG